MLLLPDAISGHAEAMRDALEEGRVADAVAVAPRLSTVRVAEILANAPAEATHTAIRALPEGQIGEILARMPPEVAADILDSFEIEEAGDLFRRIRPDYAADIYHVWSGRDGARGAELLEGLRAEPVPRSSSRAVPSRERRVSHGPPVSRHSHRCYGRGCVDCDPLGAGRGRADCLCLRARR